MHTGMFAAVSLAAARKVKHLNSYPMAGWPGHKKVCCHKTKGLLTHYGTVGPLSITLGGGGRGKVTNTPVLHDSMYTECPE